MIAASTLKKSEVVFDESTHTYLRGSDALSGITSLIHSVLLLGVYPEANDFVKNVQIPRAGYYGTCVHKAIQTWDELGVEMSWFPEKEHPTAGTIPAQDVREDLLHYQRIKPRNAKTIVSEFTVDYGNFASQIDSVWNVETPEGDKIYLVDHKTNNLDYYPGGADGLKEYLSWQLSCYAFMFERQTGLKVSGLVGNWLRKGEGELWEIGRKPDDQVKCLLDTVALPNPNYDHADFDSQRFIYINEAMQVIAPKVEEVAATGNELAVPLEITQAISALLKAEAAAKSMKEQLRAMMEEHGITKWECPEFTATIGKESTSTSFDSAAFKKADPDTYKQFTKQTTRKGSFTLKLK